MSSVYCLQFIGNGAMSEVIQRFTRSPYSHTATLIDGIVFESWAFPHPPRWVNNGVMWNSVDDVPHDAGVRADVFELRIDDLDSEAVKVALAGFSGYRYDWRNVSRFFTRLDPTDNKRVFCSEYHVLALNKCGIFPHNIAADLLSPRDVTLPNCYRKVDEIVIK